MSTPSKAALELAEEILPERPRSFTIEEERERIARLIDEKVGPLVEYADRFDPMSECYSERIGKTLANWRPQEDGK